MTQEAYAADRERYVPRAFAAHHPITVVYAEGCHVTDSDGRQYIDFAGGIGVVNVGHRPPSVVRAVHEQVDRLLHSGPVTSNAPYLQLAARLSHRVGPRRDLQALFVNSGAEAVENAVKLARHATGRPAIIAFGRSFHGRTLLTSSLTGKTAPYKTQPGAMAPEIHHATYPYPLRPPTGVARDRIIEHAISTLDELLESRVARDRVAAVIVEPVQGEGGFVVPPVGFLREVALWCATNDILLIVDEIQTGYGRTGRFFAFEHEEVDPDIVTVGKSIANGLPLAAVVAGRELWERVYPGDVGGTYGGNPVACAAGLAVLDIFDEAPLVQRAEAIGERLRARLAVLAENPSVAEIRGLGAMLAIELVEPGSLIASSRLATSVIEGARARGLILIRTGVRGNCVRLLPPLIADDAIIDRAADIIIEAVRASVAGTEAVV